MNFIILNIIGKIPKFLLRGLSRFFYVKIQTYLSVIYIIKKAFKLELINQIKNKKKEQGVI